MVKTIKLTPEELIVRHLDENGQKMNWLANKIGVSSGHLHAVLKGEGALKRDLTDENRAKINTLLGTNY